MFDYNKRPSLPQQGMVFNEMEDDFSIFHGGNFLPFYTKNLPFHISFHTKIFLHLPSILPYQGKFRPEATCNLHCILATLSVHLQVVARKGKQYGTMHLIPYLNDYRNKLP